MAVLTVGEGKQFTTIASAFTACNTGDIICIFPKVGGYVEGVLAIPKSITMRGITSSPTNNPVELYNNGNSSTLYISSAISVTIEGMSLHNTYNNGYTCLGVNHAGVTIYLNKCYLYTNCGTNYCINVNSYETILYASNCYLYAHSSASHVANFDSGTLSFSKMYLNRTYDTYSCSLSPSPLEYVTSDSVGYGCEYGTYLTSPYLKYAEGYVYDRVMPASKIVRIYDKDSGNLVSQTTSNASTGYYYLETTYSGTQYLVCLSDDDDAYNHQIIKDPIMTTVSGV